MKTVHLISEKTLKEFSLLDDNLTMEYITPVLQFVQDWKMENILGSDLYQDVKNKVEAGNVSDDYKNLLYHIKFVLLWGIQSEIQIPLNYKFRNQGYVNTQNADGSNVDLEDIKYTKAYYEKICAQYERFLIKFLDENRIKFPLYKSCASDTTFQNPITL